MPYHTHARAGTWTNAPPHRANPNRITRATVRPSIYREPHMPHVCYSYLVVRACNRSARSEGAMLLAPLRRLRASDLLALVDSPTGVDVELDYTPASSTYVWIHASCVLVEDSGEPSTKYIPFSLIQGSKTKAAANVKLQSGCLFTKGIQVLKRISKGEELVAWYGQETKNIFRYKVYIYI